MCDIPKNCLRQMGKFLLLKGRSSCLQARSLKASTTAQLQQAAVSDKNCVLGELAGGSVMKCSSQQSLKCCHPLIWLKGKKLTVYFQVLWKLEQTMFKEIHHGLTYGTSKSHFLLFKSL